MQNPNTQKIVSEVTLVLGSLDRCRSEGERAAAQDLRDTLNLFLVAEDHGVDVRKVLKGAIEERVSQDRKGGVA